MKSQPGLAETMDARLAHREQVAKLTADLFRKPDPVAEASAATFAREVGLEEPFRISVRHIRTVAEAHRLVNEEGKRITAEQKAATKEHAKAQTAARAAIEQARTLEREAAAKLAEANRAADELAKANNILAVVEDGADPGRFDGVDNGLANKVSRAAWRIVKEGK